MSDVSELVKRLQVILVKDFNHAHAGVSFENDTIQEAADALTAQQAEIERLREDGQFLLDRLSEVELTDDMPKDFLREWMGHIEPAIARFRAALTGKEGGMGDYETKTYRVVHYVEIGVSDGHGIGLWEGTIESVPFARLEDAKAFSLRAPNLEEG